jgi:hypothetical protein
MMPGFEYWAMLEPMKYYDKKREDLSDNLKKKYDAMINNENNEYIATCKYDGEWTMFIKWDGQYLIRSRSLSKVTGAYGDKTAHLPHLVEDMQNWPDNTVVLGEVCWGDFGSVSTDVGTILRCLPAKAVERQKEHKLVVKVFDVLAYAGHVYMDNDYETRTEVIGGVFGNAPEANDKYFTATYFCPNGMTPAEFADAIINQGGEGVVIQRKDYVYEPGKRSAWKTLKLKQRLPEMEFKVVASIPATKEYNGKYPESWPYWEIEREVYYPAGDDEFGNEWFTPCKEVELVENPTEEDKSHGIPVTKPYFFGWHMGVRFEYNGVMCDASSGLTDADRDWLGTIEAQNIIKNGELYVTIRAMQEASLGGLRHPVVVRLRTDM